jgi:nitronate monooxygenase
MSRRGTLDRFLGIDLPIIQAPMAGAQLHELAVAVSNAGGLGSLPCAMLAPEAMEREMTALAKNTNRPWAANFFCHAPPAADATTDAAWRELLAPYYEELGVDPKDIGAGPARVPFNREAAEVLDRFRPAVVSFHFGLPSDHLLDLARATGAKILSSATTVEEAVWLEQRGVDAIVAQGVEAGGHRGHFLSDDVTTQPTTFALVPQIVAAVRVPVIAAGGIADARGVEAALALGADGVQIGTAYLLCREASTSDVHRAALRSPEASRTALTNVFTGRPARGIVNRLMRELGPMRSGVPAFPLASAVVAPLRAAAEKRGSGDFSPLWAGQNVSGCREIAAGDLTREILSGL